MSYQVLHAYADRVNTYEDDLSPPVCVSELCLASKFLYSINDNHVARNIYMMHTYVFENVSKGESLRFFRARIFI